MKLLVEKQFGHMQKLTKGKILNVHRIKEGKISIYRNPTIHVKNDLRAEFSYSELEFDKFLVNKKTAFD